MYKLPVHNYCIFFLRCFIVFQLQSVQLFSQETNSNASGRIFSEKNETLAGATITAIHESTKNIFTTKSNADGYFYLFNLKPGGPYTLLISYTGLESIKKENTFLNFNSSGHFLNLSNNEVINFI